MDRRAGDGVNLEADLLAKYTERLLAARYAAGPGEPAGRAQPAEPRPFSDCWLLEHGCGRWVAAVRLPPHCAPVSLWAELLQRPR